MKSKISLLAIGSVVTLMAPQALAQANGASGAEDLRLTIGKSVVIDFASDIRQISTSNPEIVDASPITTREVLLHGKGFGSATMVVWNKAGQRSFYNISVELNQEGVRKLIKETFPNEDIQLASSRDSLSLSGTVSSPAIAGACGCHVRGIRQNRDQQSHGHDPGRQAGSTPGEVRRTQPQCRRAVRRQSPVDRCPWRHDRPNDDRNVRLTQRSCRRSESSGWWFGESGVAVHH